MSAFAEYFQNFNWTKLLFLLLGAVGVLLCMTVHELSHAYAAYRLGDPTAKNMGRLTLNPLKHIDLVGSLMLLIFHFGWAKPVMVDMRYFKRPKRDMAITSLAGPVSNFLLALVALLGCSLLYRFTKLDSGFLFFAFCFLCNLATMSLGLGIFNLIPISPLDGSKILFSFLPDKVYYTILRYERYAMLLILALSFFGVLSGPLSYCIQGVLSLFCKITGVPFDAVLYGGYLFSVLG